MPKNEKKAENYHQIDRDYRYKAPLQSQAKEFFL
jgi:hypothetical protein